MTIADGERQRKLLTICKVYENCSEGIEIRNVRRDLLLETLAKELPSDTIRYSSKVVLIEESGNLKVLHLADGSILKTKVMWFLIIDNN